MAVIVVIMCARIIEFKHAMLLFWKKFHLGIQITVNVLSGLELSTFLQTQNTRIKYGNPVRFTTIRTMSAFRTLQK